MSPMAKRSGKSGRLFLEGRITGIRGPLLCAEMPLATLGSIVEIHADHQRRVPGIITAFSGNVLTIAPLEEIGALRVGSVVTTTNDPLTIYVPQAIDGAVIDALGNLLSEPQTRITQSMAIGLGAKAPNPLKRTPIDSPVCSGIRALDLFSPLGRGQRLALIAGAGLGKSTLLGMIAANAEFDRIIVALVGERGREVRGFADTVMKNTRATPSTMVVSTSDQTPIKKLLAAETALSISEYFRSRGEHVLLIIDSLTRLARSMRDIGLANGELPIRQGYPASVLVELPRFLERMGTAERGSITALLSLLEEPGVGNDFVSHEIASLLDGHVVLDATLAQRNHFPAIDVTRSLSRLAPRLLDRDLWLATSIVRKGIQRLNRDRDLLLFGGEADQELSHLLSLEGEINSLLIQDSDSRVAFSESRALLIKLAEKMVATHDGIRSQNSDSSLLPPSRGKKDYAKLPKR